MHRLKVSIDIRFREMKKVLVAVLFGLGLMFCNSMN